MKPSNSHAADFQGFFFTRKKSLETHKPANCRPGNSLFAFGLLLLVLYTAGLGVRLSSVSVWGTAEMRVINGAGLSEPLLATPDAYFWLAGAAGKGAAAALAPSTLLRAVSSFSGMSPARAALLLPVLLASTLGPLLAALCRSLGFPLAGLCAGLLASLAPAYLCRTSLGYYDTDMLLLSLAVLTALVLLFLLREKGKSGFVASVLLGAGLAWMQHWHRLLPVSNAAMVFAAFAVLWLQRQTRPRPEAAYCLVLFAVSLFFSWPGVVAAGAAALVLSRGSNVFWKTAAGPKLLFSVCCLVVCGLVLFSNLRNEGCSYLQRARTKSFSTAPAGVVHPPAYPDMTRTIAEDERISFAHVLVLLHPWAGVALAGLCGFFWLAGMRPEALLLGPLLAFGLSAPFLGARVVMFAVPAVALGFGVGTEVVLGRIPAFYAGKCISWIVRVLLALVVSIPLVLYTPPPEPALSSAHAQALQKLGTLEPHGTGPVPMVWTWWDFGYAASCLTGFRSFADPGRQGPEYVYFLSKVLGADSLQTAYASMQFTAVQNFHPWEALNRLGARKAQQLMTDMAAYKEKEPENVRQFVVVSLDGLSLLPVITDFARWNLFTGAPDGEQGLFTQLMPPVEIDLQHGRVKAPQSGTQTQVGTMLLWDTCGEEIVFDETNPVCLVALSRPERYFLLDRRLYQSNYLQLLLGNTDKDQELFHLVLNNAPYVRVYALVTQKGG